MAGGGDGGHVQRGPHRGPTAPGAPLALAAATVLVQGRHPGEGRDLPAVSMPNSGKSPSRVRATTGPMPGMERNNSSFSRQMGLCAQRLVQLAIEGGDLLAEPDHVGIQGRTQPRRQTRAAVALGGAHLQQLPPAGQHRGQILRHHVGQGATGGCTRWANNARSRASRASLLASCPVARAKSRTWRGLTTATAQPRPRASAAVTARFVPTGGFQHDQARALRRQLRHQGGDALVIVGDAPGRASPLLATSSHALATSMPIHAPARSCGLLSVVALAPRRPTLPDAGSPAAPATVRALVGRQPDRTKLSHDLARS